MHRYAVALSTAGSEATSKELARALVNRGAAACVSIIAEARSFYKWKGEMCEESEWLLVIKTRADKQALVESIFRELHSYEVPELIFLPIEAGSSDYLSWLHDSLS